MRVAIGPFDALGLVGSTVDQVRIEACVEAGGFGLIYRGFHEGLGETVAMKCLRIASIQKTNESVRTALAGRFRDETKLLYRLSQGNLDIVRCIGSGTLIAPRTKEYTPYMILEWLEGCTLSAELKGRREQGLPSRTLEGAVHLLDSAVGALAYAHTHEVVHRDVKPSNLFLTQTREGVRMKVLDFGLAKILSDEAIGIRRSVDTGVGVHFCSASYGAPEQFTSEAGAIGPWTDVYSLTLILLEVMLGDKVRPAGSLAQGLAAALDPRTGSPSASSLGLAVPPEVEELLLSAVAQNPLDRPQDAGVFWGSLKHAMGAAKEAAAATKGAEEGGSAPTSHGDAAAMGGAAPSPFTSTMLMQDAPTFVPLTRSTTRLETPAAALKSTLPMRATSPFASAMPVPTLLDSPHPIRPSWPPPAVAAKPSASIAPIAPIAAVTAAPATAAPVPPAAVVAPPEPAASLAPEPPRRRAMVAPLALLAVVVLAVLAAMLYWTRSPGH